MTFEKKCFIDWNKVHEQVIKKYQHKLVILLKDLFLEEMFLIVQTLIVKIKTTDQIYKIILLDSLMHVFQQVVFFFKQS